MEQEQKKRKAKWQNDYIAKAYDRINLTVDKGQKDIIKAHAEKTGESVNGFINRAISETMEYDRTGARAQGDAPRAPESPQNAAPELLPAEVLETAKEAAELSGEAVEQYITRAVKEQARRDHIGRQLEAASTSGRSRSAEAARMAELRKNPPWLKDLERLKGSDTNDQ